MVYLHGTNGWPWGLRRKERRDGFKGWVAVRTASELGDYKLGKWREEMEEKRVQRARKKMVVFDENVLVDCEDCEVKGQGFQDS